jgi:hypothetical protein
LLNWASEGSSYDAANTSPFNDPELVEGLRGRTSQEAVYFLVAETSSVSSAVDVGNHVREELVSNVGGKITHG